MDPEPAANRMPARCNPIITAAPTTTEMTVNRYSKIPLLIHIVELYSWGVPGQIDRAKTPYLSDFDETSCIG